MNVHLSWINSVVINFHLGKFDVKISNDTSCSYLPGNLEYVVQFRKPNTKTLVTMVPGYVIWLYALIYYEIRIMAIIIMYALDVIAIIKIVSKYVLITYAVHHF